MTTLGEAIPMKDRFPIWNEIIAERLRQAAKWEGVHEHGKGDCSSPDVPASVKVTVILEEAGEVARAMLDQDDAKLRRELTELAACCVAWLEMFDPETPTQVDLMPFRTPPLELK